MDVYKKPYNEEYPVVCMDESPKQLIGETRLPIAMKSGKEKKVDFEYERKGVCNIFMANEPLKGTRHVEIKERKTKKDWAYFIRNLADINYKEARKITLVMDNLNTHCTRCSSLKKLSGYGTGSILFIPQNMGAG